VRLQLDHFSSPVGTILLVHDEQGALRALDFEDYEARMHRLLRLHYGRVELTRASAPDRIITSLGAYFDGELGAPAAIVVETGGTPFQRSVWAALRKIPAGTTTSYGRLATSIDCPKAVRAVGLANGANPVAIVVPCHRVIGASGSLTGFGGGLHRKQWLLEHEGAIAGSTDTLFTPKGSQEKI
jgi:methylated-DNA-[protein]-cysteine S-methyltransferase